MSNWNMAKLHHFFELHISQNTVTSIANNTSQLCDSFNGAICRLSGHLWTCERPWKPARIQAELAFQYQNEKYSSVLVPIRRVWANLVTWEIVIRVYSIVTVHSSNNKLIFLYLKTRRCKYYTLNTMYIKLHKLPWIEIHENLILTKLNNHTVQFYCYIK